VSGVSQGAIGKYLRGRDMRGEWAAKILHSIGATARTPDGPIDLSLGLRTHVVSRLSADGPMFVSRVTGRTMATVSRYMSGGNDMTTAQVQPLVDLARIEIKLPNSRARNIKRVLKRQRYATKWTNSEITHLGDDADRKVSRKLSRSASSIRAAKSRYLAPKNPTRRRGWPEHEAALLGTIPDHEVASRCNVTRLTVIRERQRRGIAAYQKQRGPSSETQR
jgi:hypothetical protein